MFRQELGFLLGFLVLGPSITCGMLPQHSWDHVPLFLHIRYANISDADIFRIASNFSMVTVQPYVPYPPGELGEGQTKEIKDRVQAVNPMVPVLIYYNTYFADPLYNFEKVVADHPSWWLYEDGKPYQPGGRYVFNMSNPDAVEGWSGFYGGVLSAKEADGGYADSGCGTQVPWLPAPERESFAEGQYMAQNMAQLAVGKDALFVSNCPVEATSGWKPSGVNSIMYESFCSDFLSDSKGVGDDLWCRDELFWSQAFASSPNTSVIQCRYYLNHDNDYNPTMGLAAFLIMATDKHFFGASVSWDWDGDWSKQYPAYSEPLGIPSPAHMLDPHGCTWNRTFASGAIVETNFCGDHKYGKITWPSGKVDQQGSPSSPLSTPTFLKPIPSNIQFVPYQKINCPNPIKDHKNNLVCITIHS